MQKQMALLEDPSKKKPIDENILVNKSIINLIRGKNRRKRGTKAGKRALMASNRENQSPSMSSSKFGSSGKKKLGKKKFNLQKPLKYAPNNAVEVTPNKRVIKKIHSKFTGRYQNSLLQIQKENNAYSCFNNNYNRKVR